MLHISCSDNLLSYVLGLAVKLKSPPGGDIRDSVLAMPIGLGHGALWQIILTINGHDLVAKVVIDSFPKIASAVDDRGNLEKHSGHCAAVAFVYDRCT